eukprot:4387154-Prymnesium_polylepis.1
MAARARGVWAAPLTYSGSSQIEIQQVTSHYLEPWRLWSASAGGEENATQRQITPHSSQEVTPLSGVN